MTGPTYDADQPKPNDTYSDSQPSFLQNFGSLYDTFLANHISLDALSGAGNHTNAEMIELDNGPQTDISDIAFYVKKVANQTDQLFMRYPGNGQEVQLSGYQIYSLGNNQYFTYLPGGGIIYFGEIVLTSFFPKIIELQPAICTHIVTVNLCLKGTIATQKPWVGLQRNQRNIFTGVFVNVDVSPITPQTFYYIVWGQP